MSDNLVLLGFSGSGKSSVGRILAQRLGWSFVDTDARIVARFGVPIARLFAERGEAAFRAAEREAVAAVCAERHRVISLGGGAPVDEANRTVIAEGNLVVRLEASPEELLRRLRAQGPTEERPLLNAPDPLERIRGLLDARRDAYAIADVVVNTEGLSPEEVAEAIEQRMATPRPSSVPSPRTPAAQSPKQSP
ncbi:MAG TPA: shikimate kinase [Chloroflexota bacterium]|nr:shikimate kinase [Chloroflexota bacterium]